MDVPNEPAETKGEPNEQEKNNEKTKKEEEEQKQEEQESMTEDKKKENNTSNKEASTEENNNNDNSSNSKPKTTIPASIEQRSFSFPSRVRGSPETQRRLSMGSARTTHNQGRSQSMIEQQSRRLESTLGIGSTDSDEEDHNFSRMERPRTVTTAVFEATSLPEGVDGTSEVFDKDGFINFRVGKFNKKKQLSRSRKWNYTYFNLIGGSLYYYKTIDDHLPQGMIQLSDCKITKNVEDFKPLKHCFSLTTENFEFAFSAQAEDEMNEWTEAIESNLNKPLAPPLTKDKKKGRVALLKERAKKNVVGKAATSKVGKKALRSKAPKEVMNLIAALKSIIEKDTKSTKKANEIEDNILRIGVKVYFLVSEGKLDPSQVMVAEKPMRNALALFITCRNHVFDVHQSKTRKLKEDILLAKLQQVEQLVKEGAENLIMALTNLILPRNIKRIQDTVAYIGDHQVLFRILMDRSFDSELYYLTSAAEHYSQFHFYPEDVRPRRYTIF
jgi:hypothetical protein